MLISVRPQNGSSASHGRPTRPFGSSCRKYSVGQVKARARATRGFQPRLECVAVPVGRMERVKNLGHCSCSRRLLGATEELAYHGHAVKRTQQNASGCEFRAKEIVNAGFSSSFATVTAAPTTCYSGLAPRGWHDTAHFR